MIPAIVTLIVGLAIVIISFFLEDGKKEDDTEGTLAESREKIEKQLDEYCDLLVEKKKNDLKKQGDEVKSSMEKGLNDVKSTSKKELEEIRESSKKEIDEYRENAKKEIEDFKTAADNSIKDMTSGTRQQIDKAMADYESSIADAKDKMKAELERCSSQLSEKAKKQMIDYINQSLTEAYESYDPDDTSEKEPITYDEVSTETGADMPDTDNVTTEETAESAEDKTSEEKLDSIAEDEAKAENEKTENEKTENEKTENDQDAQENVVSIEESQVTDSAFTVVEAENPEKMAADIEEGNVVPAPQKNRNNRSRKKKKKKSAQNKPIDIWDEGVDIETQVADLHKKGLSIMEIANKLGIGVGEAKVMIDQMNETKETKNTDNQ